MLAIIKKKNWYFRNNRGVLNISFLCCYMLHKLRLRAATSWDRGGRWKEVLAVNFFLEQVSSFKWDLVLVVTLKR